MKRRRRKSLTIVLFLLVLLFAALSGYLAYRCLTLRNEIEEMREEAAAHENDQEPVVLSAEGESKDGAEGAEENAKEADGPGAGEHAEDADEHGTGEDGPGLPDTEPGAFAGSENAGTAGDSGEDASGAGTAETAGNPETAADPDAAREPEAERKEAIEQEARAMMENMSLEQKVAQLFFVTPEQLTGAGTVTKAGDATRAAVENRPVGGLIYFEGSLVSKEQTQALLAGTKAFYTSMGLPEPFLSTDEEGGTVVRIADNGAFGVRNVGDMRDLGATGDISKAEEAGHYIGSYMAELGFNMDFAPVADVLTNSENTVVRRRSFGSDPQLVKEMVTACSDGLLSEGVLPVWKHFPGHGSTAADTHAGYAYSNQTMEELLAEDLVPYENANGHAPCIMAAHISLPEAAGNDLPATLSEAVITGILRDQLGYEGVVITDALNMGAIANNYSSADAAKRALSAGCDMLLMPYDFTSAYEGVLAAVRSGEIPEERIDESVTRILRCKAEMKNNA